MDILRKELDQIYSLQYLEKEDLDGGEIEICKRLAGNMTSVTGACCVITDAACDRCYLFGGRLASLLGIGETPFIYRDISSSDEDVIYNRLHPGDLVEKRMLEYEYFKFVHPLPPDEKLRYKATCRIRIKDRYGQYRVISNSTQIMRPSPAGKIWLILCCYDLSPEREMASGISPRIVNNHSGEIIDFSFSDKKKHVLTDREKEVLLLIKDGYPSKQIADMLGISIHTVNRHRQNILERLSVGNSVEAIMAATVMGLL
ncbi:MAG: LuxR C-terminal-related transcriptional regulator [Bacteroidales bacterium]|nr:LuxR C-terminal-related transcriptional regulator [Bacteroidales bacterium]